MAVTSTSNTSVELGGIGPVAHGPVREARRDHEPPDPPGANAGQPLVPPVDDLVGAQHEAEGGSADVGVELQPLLVRPRRIVEPARVEHRERVAADRPRARPGAQIGLREGGRGHGRRVAAAGGEHRHEERGGRAQLTQESVTKNHDPIIALRRAAPAGRGRGRAVPPAPVRIRGARSRRRECDRGRDDRRSSGRSTGAASGAP